MENPQIILPEIIPNQKQCESKQPIESVGKETGHPILRVIILMAASFLVFTIGGYNYFMSSDVRTIIKCINPVLFSLTTLGLYRSKKFHQYWKISCAFLAVATGFMLAWFFGGWYLWVPSLDANSVEGWAVSKLAEALPIILSIFLFTKLSGDNSTDLYLKGGNGKKALLFGLLCVPLGFIQFAVQGGFSLSMNAGSIIEGVPWLVVFAFSNSLMEELMFRGLFLRKYEAFMSPTASLALISAIFAIFHVVLLPFMGLEGILVFVTFLFFESWLWGKTIQKSKSIWGAVLAHAIGDILFLVVAFGM